MLIVSFDATPLQGLVSATFCDMVTDPKRGTVHLMLMDESPETVKTVMDYAATRPDFIGFDQEADFPFGDVPTVSALLVPSVLDLG